MLWRILACFVLLVLSEPGCSSGSSVGNDGGSGTCPAQRPFDGTSCTTTCTYGHTTCCGMTYSQFTCTCQAGGFSCAQTVECNIVCQDASPTDAQASGG
jgi:hypothetical protein